MQDSDGNVLALATWRREGRQPEHESSGKEESNRDTQK
jgi:hypothetical protein